MNLLVINGPNINMLGLRQPGIYGEQSYLALLELIESACKGLRIEVECFQSNHEGAIVDKIQEAYGKADGIVINPAAYTHTSIAILDALLSVDIPTVEVHISDIYTRESFRHRSYISAACKKVITGKGFNGYVKAIEFLASLSKDCAD